MHVESEGCRWAEFGEVQEKARWGIGNVVGRMVEAPPPVISSACRESGMGGGG
jgi:hypothetical protein